VAVSVLRPAVRLLQGRQAPIQPRLKGCPRGYTLYTVHAFIPLAAPLYGAAEGLFMLQKGGVPALGRQIAVALYAVAMVVVIVGVDFAFFRNRFWERLAVNVGIVLVFGAFYFRFLKSP
jgi:hypothetical protein